MNKKARSLWWSHSTTLLLHLYYLELYLAFTHPLPFKLFKDFLAKEKL